MLSSSRRVALLTTLVLSVGLCSPLAAQAERRTGGHVAGDIDGDGRADLVVSREHGISVFYTGGLGRRDIDIAEGNVSGVAVGDFNGDGFADVAVGDANAVTSTGSTPHYDGAVYVWYGSSTGLGPRVAFPGPVGSDDGFGAVIAAAQLTGDHHVDLVVADEDNDTAARLTILVGRAGGLSAAHEVHLARERTSAITVGDLNGDGRPDLVIGRPDSGAAALNDDEEIDAQEGTLAIYYGTAHGLSSRRQIVHGLAAGVGYGALGTSLSIARINGDRYADIVAGAPTTSLDAHGRPVRQFYAHVTGAGSIAVLYGSRTGISAAHRSVLSLATRGVPGAPRGGDDFGQHVTTGDLNGDGRIDVVAEMDQADNGTDGAVFVFRGAASGITTSHVQRIGSHTLGNPHHRNYEPMLYGSALAVYRPTNSPHAWLAIGAPGYIRSWTQWFGLLDLFPTTSNGVTTHGAHRIFGAVDKDNFGAYLAP